MWNGKSLEPSGAEVICKDREYWRDFVYGIDESVNVLVMTENGFDAKQ